ncbi:MFS transporter [Actinomadura sp. 6N118]|uniref:MFS transporter n=1 Tax=Actinomadura sp. 6N118 TaxID=3375151 RepID=UPI003798CCB3
MPSHTRKPSPARPRSPRGGLALPVIAAAQLLIVMDGTIVTVGLPVIGSGLGIAAADLDWVLTAYALAFGGMLLAGGRAGDVFGRRRLFQAGLVVFLLASLLGGVAQNGATLIAARVLQGMGGATPPPDALTHGYTAGLLGAGVFYLAAILATVLLMRPRPGHSSPQATTPEKAHSSPV